MQSWFTFKEEQEKIIGGCESENKSSYEDDDSYSDCSTIDTVGERSLVDLESEDNFEQHFDDGKDSTTAIIITYINK